MSKQSDVFPPRWASAVGTLGLPDADSAASIMITLEAASGDDEHLARKASSEKRLGKSEQKITSSASSNDDDAKGKIPSCALIPPAPKSRLSMKSSLKGSQLTASRLDTTGANIAPGSQYSISWQDTKGDAPVAEVILVEQFKNPKKWIFCCCMNAKDEFVPSPMDAHDKKEMQKRRNKQKAKSEQENHPKGHQENHPKGHHKETHPKEKQKAKHAHTGKAK